MNNRQYFNDRRHELRRRANYKPTPTSEERNLTVFDGIFTAIKGYTERFLDMPTELKQKLISENVAVITTIKTSIKQMLLFIECLKNIFNTISWGNSNRLYNHTDTKMLKICGGGSSC